MTPPRPTTTATMGTATPPMLSPAPQLMQLGMNQPQCPMHSLPMLVKRNRRDNSNFWACPMFPRCRTTMPIEASEILAPTSPMSVAGEQPTAAMPAPPQFPTPTAASAETEIAAQRAALAVEYERIRAMEEQLHQQQQITVQAQTDLQNQAAAAQMQYAQAHADLQSQQAEVHMQQQANLQAAAIMQQQAEAVAAAQVGALTQPGMPSAGWPVALSPQNAAVSSRWHWNTVRTTLGRSTCDQLCRTTSSGGRL